MLAAYAQSCDVAVPLGQHFMVCMQAMQHYVSDSDPYLSVPGVVWCLSSRHLLNVLREMHT